MKQNDVDELIAKGLQGPESLGFGQLIGLAVRQEIERQDLTGVDRDAFRKILVRRVLPVAATISLSPGDVRPLVRDLVRASIAEARGAAPVGAN